MLWQPHAMRVSSVGIELNTGCEGTYPPKDMPSALGRWEELFRGAVEEEEEMDTAENDDADQIKD